ncbi:di-trans,poly-cis-decaprenylcistransferase [Orenia metallireducens]|uniref:Isoprenyl transferase n=1 Tax=Orenia metallireducens TaxID=1413210 RepID=A0A1C0AA06_9FIRM|nr:isoprenyl transferase [Orenia metallireducens]OCL27120.1 di-trans,poly-cis-decaprenylcistransferase [Orenia metallireducens]
MWGIIDKALDKFKDNSTFEDLILEVKKKEIPTHVAFIMDGNGRWAKRRGLPRSAGHQAGVKILKEIVKISKELGIKYITTYAFSTENWKRPEKEVNFLMKLFEKVFLEELEKLNQEGVKVNIIGYKERLPQGVKDKVEQAMERTKNNDTLVLNIALDYGGRSEIIESVRNIGKSLIDSEISLEDIDEKLISQGLYTNQQPDPDLLIRPGGEKRISNFLLWQLAYTELYFTDVYWPDFNKVAFLEVIKDYQQRERRFGGLKKK